jgi:hypothetical protein
VIDFSNDVVNVAIGGKLAASSCNRIQGMIFAYRYERASVTFAARSGSAADITRQ